MIPVSQSNDPPNNGCEFCNEPYYGSLCAYQAIFECTYWSTLGEKIAEKCITLRKDCPVGCTYSSKWAYQDSDPLTGSALPSPKDYPVLQPGECRVFNTGDPRAICDFCMEVECFDLTINSWNLPDGPSTLPSNNPVQLVFDPSKGECAYVGYAYQETDGDNSFGITRLFQAYIKLLITDGVGTLTFTYYFGGFDNPSGIIQKNFVADIGTFYCDSTSFSYSSQDGLYFVNGSIAPSASPCAAQTVGNITGWLGGCTWMSQRCEDDYGYGCVTKWVLRITSATTAILTLTTRSGHTAVYSTDAFHCYSRSTFLMEYQDFETTGLPRCLCVAPVATPIFQADCSGSCCDDGAAARDFTFAVDVMACGDVAIPTGSYSFGRGVDLPVGVTNPYDRCSYFWREFSYTPSVACDKWPGQVGVLVTCGGVVGELPEGIDPEANIVYVCEIYCYDGELDTWVSQGFLEIYQQCCQAGGVIDVPDVECCCEEIVVCCCENPLDASYSLEVRDPSNNVVATVSVAYNVLNGHWESGAFSLGGGCDIDMMWFQCVDGFCMWEAYVVFTGSAINNALQQTSVVCDPFTGIWVMNSLNCANGFQFIVT